MARASASNPPADARCWQCEAPTTGAAICPVCEVVQPPADVDPFTRLGLPVAIRIDAAALYAKRLALLDQVHPDRFAGHRDEARGFAHEQAVAINDAARALGDPLDRARTLMQMRRWPVRGDQLAPDDRLRLAEYRHAIDELRGTDAHTERQQLGRALASDVQRVQDLLFSALELPTADRAVALEALSCLRALRGAQERLAGLDTTPDRTGRITR